MKSLSVELSDIWVNWLFAGVVMFQNGCAPDIVGRSVVCGLTGRCNAYDAGGGVDFMNAGFIFLINGLSIRLSVLEL